MICESTKGRVPIKAWSQAHEIESEAWDQALNLANHPDVFHHVALMPDVHTGYGMPIGGVVALRDHISPGCVGYDIGCGMVALRTSAHEVNGEALRRVCGAIRELVALGEGGRSGIGRSSLLPVIDAGLSLPIVERELASAAQQIGTLGGGNHFIEIQSGSDGHVWIMVHSGSRNVGRQVADHYMKVAKRLNEETHKIPTSWQLETLDIDTPDGRLYHNEMTWALDFAKANRKLMMDLILGALSDEIGCEEQCRYDVHHNYAMRELHFGEKVWVHRKGATSANLGQIGIIPGSQGTRSYIVTGLGSVDSFGSCSHGAGRTMSRSKARKTLDLAAEQKLLDDQGILHSIRGQRDLDEAASAYKPIDVVMANQSDLVEVRVELTPLAVLKG